MIGDKIFMGINKNPKSEQYAKISENIKKRIGEIGGKYNGYDIVFFDNTPYWDSIKQVPFKRINETKMACNNGSTCIEPILFNYLLSNKFITTEQLRNRTDYSYTCLWVGDPSPSEESDYTIGTQGGKKDIAGMTRIGHYERMYERLFTEYCLSKRTLNQDTLVNCHDIVFNLMLACPGCQMNYNKNINNEIKIFISNSTNYFVGSLPSTPKYKLKTLLKPFSLRNLNKRPISLPYSFRIFKSAFSVGIRSEFV